jgi:hypothetical protein
MVWKTKVLAKVQGCSFLCFFGFFFHSFFKKAFCCSNYVRMYASCIFSTMSKFHNHPHDQRFFFKEMNCAKKMAITHKKMEKNMMINSKKI